MIIACPVGMGLGVTVVPELFSVLPASLQILTSNGIVAGKRSIVRFYKGISNRGIPFLFPA
ncbi:hypothetical protein NSA56_16170 [Oceanobacillus caeni]|nr:MULTISPECIES: hypothetical protein [Oceanobacillus]KKE79128.1 hypothetical protein WH51_08625 [Bacilli bacterium VT-13-104]PZD87613.1 hypothetical protein DEJ64_05180 [Bacilli bacterium]MBU8790432.1 hypothetical protein [Oceanobacillus caeni]MCR1835880.1 hypothetical protein [Oceanobacillus caeni]PZD90651.1 hypothetical protein DEJ60_01980 [Bacilli bacterium]